MSNFARPLPTHLRNQSLGGSQQQSPVLLARIAEKKAELANLKDLQALSGGLADQMQMLADKLSTLSDGTEGTSTVFVDGVCTHAQGKSILGKSG
jgi:DASH complex subunit DAD2